MKNLLIAILTATCLTSCFYSGMDDEYSYINPALKKYVDSFVIEGKNRGVDIDLYSVKIDFAILNVSAMTYYKTNSIAIDSSNMAWKINPEALVHHELGHLILNRDHDSRWENGKIKSIMHPHELPIYLNHGIEGIAFSDKNRKYYLDELFQ